MTPPATDSAAADGYAPIPEWLGQTRAPHPAKAAAVRGLGSSRPISSDKSPSINAFESLDSLEQHLAEWMTIADQRCLGTTREAPIVRFEREERAALRPLPLRALPRRTQRLRRSVVGGTTVYQA